MYHILICDDEQDIVNALKIYLMNPDFKLFEANTGGYGARGHSPDSA